MTTPTDIAGEVYDPLCRRNFPAFVCATFKIVYPDLTLRPSWHIDVLSYHLQGMAEGKLPNRVVINLPPRTLKSFICSVALPAWLLGLDPSRRIICASYSEDLAFKFSRECRTLMQSRAYRRLFRR